MSHYLALRENREEVIGPFRESNSGPRPPEGRIIPLDQKAAYDAVLSVFHKKY